MKKISLEMFDLQEMSIIEMREKIAGSQCTINDAQRIWTGYRSGEVTIELIN